MATPSGSRSRGDATWRWAAVTGAAFGVSTLLGIARDLMLAGYFGANADTDAFLVAWSIPENAVPLLIDSAMALVMVPIFSRALRDRQLAGTERYDLHDPVREMVAATLPKLVAVLAVVAAAVAAFAPWLVAGLFPGLANPALAVASLRTIAVSLVFIGVAGYFATALRAHGVFGPPAVISIAMNVGIVGLMFSAHHRLGVLAAVLGATIGAALMVAVQLPAFVRRIGLPRPVGRAPKSGLGAVVPVLVFVLVGQSQVFVERFVAALLPPGTITQLSYVQKIGQQFTAVALILAVVSFPRLARDIAEGNLERARRRAGLDVQFIAGLVLAAIAYLVAFAPEVIALLLQRGAFTARETAATVPLLRVYVWGLLGQAVLEVVSRSVFSHRATYRPAVVVGLGVVVTGLIANLGAPIWGASAVAAGNAIGLTLSALLMVCLHSSEVLPARRIGLALVTQVPATVSAVVFAGWLETRLRTVPPTVSVPLGGLAVLAVYGAVAAVTGGVPLPARVTAAVRDRVRRRPVSTHNTDTESTTSRHREGENRHER